MEKDLNSDQKYWFQVIYQRLAITMLKIQLILSFTNLIVLSITKNIT
jgi:hypothetical protein